MGLNIGKRLNMNNNNWSGHKKCAPGKCQYNNSQCLECDSCFSPMNPPGQGHDDGCTRAKLELLQWKETVNT